MRSLSRLAAACAIAMAITGCAGSSTPLSVAGAPNENQAGVGNSQPNVTGVAGTGGVTVPAGSIQPLLLDNGTLGTAIPAATYVGYNATAADTQSAVQSPSDAAPATGPTPPPNPATAADLGSHSVAITGNGLTQAIVTSGLTYNLTYSFGGQFVDYTQFVTHLSALAGTVPSAVSLELVGGASTTGAAGFDVRIACAGSPLTATFKKITCSIPAYAASVPPVNFSGPNAVNPGATGLFAPQNAKVYFVLTYATPFTTTTTLGIDNTYLLQ